ncbi:MAG: hypothetical protein C0616_01700 [Desulfuromonas sp.]|nr:MAG: hypothetical protein C0616_01700 [Desulfuromonas sp.]
MLLAVDLGLKSGLACFDREGILCWYRSTNFGSTTRLRRAVPKLLFEIHGLERLILEGGGPLADIWLKEAKKIGLDVSLISAERWRRDLLIPRQRRTGQDAKTAAIELARKIIDGSRAPRPTSLRHDAAEAILIGYYGVTKVERHPRNERLG